MYITVHNTGGKILNINEMIRPIALQLLLLAMQGVLYTLVQYFQDEYHDMERPIDGKIPLVRQAILVYILWYPLIAIYPLYLYTCSQIAYMQYMFGIAVDIVLSIMIYVLYPTSFKRPPAPTGGLSGQIFKLIRFGNYRGLNCTPSMHCSMCFIIILSALSCSCVGIAVKSFICVVSSMIIGSTVLTKQHVVIDLITAVPLAVICFLIGRGLYFVAI